VAYAFDAELILWDARKHESWTLITVPVEESEEIRHRTEGMANGFGSVRVTATIGSSTWQTSIFPDAGEGTYVLPVKKAVRKAEGLDPGDSARVTVELRDF